MSILLDVFARTESYAKGQYNNTEYAATIPFSTVVDLNFNENKEGFVTGHLIPSQQDADSFGGPVTTGVGIYRIMIYLNVLKERFVLYRISDFFTNIFKNRDDSENDMQILFLSPVKFSSKLLAQYNVWEFL